MAILGPTRMRAELPAEWWEAGRFLEACGYVREEVYTDFVRSGKGRVGPSPLVVPISVVELLESGAVSFASRCAWERSEATLRNRRERLSALAVLSDVRIEAYLVFDPSPGKEQVEAWGLGCAPGVPAEPLLRALIATLPARQGRPISMPRVAPGEIDFEVLGRLGFEESGKTVGYGAEAVPG